MGLPHAAHALEQEAKPWSAEAARAVSPQVAAEKAGAEPRTVGTPDGYSQA